MRSNEIFELIKSKFPQVAQEEPAETVVVPKQLLLELVDYLKNGEMVFNNLHCVTAVDRKEGIELIYIFYSLALRHSVTLKIYLSLGDLAIESLTGFYRSADWFEREVYDLFGVAFLNHPNLTRILNPLDWKGYPLRKDYAHPDFIKKPPY